MSKKNKWSFVNLVDKAGYSAGRCRVVNDDIFAVDLLRRRPDGCMMQRTVCFSVGELEQARDREWFVKAALDAAWEECVP